MILMREPNKKISKGHKPKFHIQCMKYEQIIIQINYLSIIFSD